MKTKKILDLVFPFIIILTSCLPMGDSIHSFQYQGKIIANDKLPKDSVIILFDNLGDIIYNLSGRQQTDTSIVDTEGRFVVTGNFFAAGPASEIDGFNETDSLSFEVLRKGQIIKQGKINIAKMKRQYIDSSYLTIFTLPDLLIE